MKNLSFNEIEALQNENTKLQNCYRELQEKYLVQDRILRRTIKFIEKQSGAEHDEDLYFIRDGLGDFWINLKGIAQQTIRGSDLTSKYPFKWSERPPTE